MKKLIRHLSTATALGAALVAGACENVGDTVAPGLKPSPMVVMSVTGETYVVAQENDPEAGEVSAEIGAAGGELILGAHKLYVSPNAVSAPAMFTMRRDAEDPLRVKLTAGEGNSVGKAGFSAPVTLELTYSNVADLPSDEASLLQAYYREDGLVETLTTQVDTVALTTRAQLPHFSIFGLIWP